MKMAHCSPKSKTHQVIFLVLLLVLAGLGQDVDYGEGDDVVDDAATEAPESTTSVPPRQVNAEESQRIEKILKDLEKAQAARDSLNQTVHGMEIQIQMILNSVQSPAQGSAPSGAGNNNSNNDPASGGIAGLSVQANTALILKLEREIKALKNQTVALNVEQREPAPPVVGIPALQLELLALSNRMEAMNTDLRHQNEEHAQYLFGSLRNMTKSVKELLEVDKEKKRQQIVQNIVQAFAASQNGRVKALLDDLTRRRLLYSSMLESVRGMFNGDINKYSKIIRVLQSAKRGQYKAGLTALCNLFYNSSSEVAGNFSATPQSLVDEPKYLHLVYLAKTNFEREFEKEFLPKFPTMVQNLVWKPKTCIRNLLSNQYLVLNSEKAMQDGGYPVISRKIMDNSTGFCDWEIFSLSDRTAFIIRQTDSTSEGPLINLNVLEGAVAVGNNIRNNHHLWKIQLKKNAQEATLQSIPGSSNKPSYFLCSSSEKNSTVRPVVLKSDGDEKACSWFIDG